jgi:hypothetical protein
MRFGGGRRLLLGAGRDGPALTFAVAALAAASDAAVARTDAVGRGRPGAVFAP